MRKITVDCDGRCRKRDRARERYKPSIQCKSTRPRKGKNSPRNHTLTAVLARSLRVADGRRGLARRGGGGESRREKEGNDDDDDER